MDEDAVVGGCAKPFPGCLARPVDDCDLSLLGGYTSESSEWMLNRSALLSLWSCEREAEDSDRNGEIPFELPFRGMEEPDDEGMSFVASGPEYPSSLYAGGGAEPVSGNVQEMVPSTLFR